MIGKAIDRKKMMVFIFCVVFATDWGRKSPGFLHLIYNCSRNLILLVLRCHGYKFSDFNRSVQAFSLHKVVGNSSQHCNNKKPALLSCSKRIIYHTSESTINSDFHSLLFSFSCLWFCAYVQVLQNKRCWCIATGTVLSTTRDLNWLFC